LQRFYFVAAFILFYCTCADGLSSDRLRLHGALSNVRVAASFPESYYDYPDPVVYEYNLRSRNVKHPKSTAKNNTVLCLLFYEHAQLYCALNVEPEHVAVWLRNSALVSMNEVYSTSGRVTIGMGF